jgi:cytochrome c-type biogenesis protein CcmE
MMDESGVEVPTRRRRGRDPKVATASMGVVLAVGLVMAASAIVAVVLFTMKDKAIYSRSVDVLLQEKDKFADRGRSVRVEGNLVHGSLVHREKPCEYDFTITKNGTDLPVRFAQCVVPDTFRDVPGMDVGVTVEGELHKDDTFEATMVLAKCPSKYEMKNRAAQGEHMPHDTVTPN